MSLQGRRIILGVTGSIAAYKSCEIVRRLKDKGADVRVVVTENGCRFITPLTLASLSGNKVYTAMFEDQTAWGAEHISLAESCDLLLVAPASANVIAKLSYGFADDLLTTLALALTAPVVIAPAMNDVMYESNATAENINRLKSRGVVIIEPDSGKLASGKIGRGRLAEIETIIANTEFILSGKDLSGIKILVTAGPTCEPIDAVRFISNPSSGKMGYEIAAQAALRGADTKLVSGPVHIKPPWNVDLIRVDTAVEMMDATLSNYADSDVVIMAAAVCDFRPEVNSPHKINKENIPDTISLSRNPDILKELGRNKGSRILAGFSMDTGEHSEKALKKLKDKNLDLIVMNDLSLPGAGFREETNIVSIIDSGGIKEDYDLMPKSLVADIVLDKILQIRKARNKQ